MVRRWLKLSALPAVLTALAVTACSERSEPTGVLAVDGPSFAANPDAKKKKLIKGKQYTGPTFAQQLITPAGGALQLGDHRLEVPKGSVHQATVFTMQVIDDGFIRVELTATKNGSTDKNDVGRRGFAKPVVLTLSYKDAAENVDPASLRTVWLKDGTADGDLVPVPSQVDGRAKKIISRLSHFSGYGVATDKDLGGAVDEILPF